jgi:hypothetical protein
MSNAATKTAGDQQAPSAAPSGPYWGFQHADDAGALRGYWAKIDGRLGALLGIIVSVVLWRYSSNLVTLGGGLVAGWIAGRMLGSGVTVALAGLAIWYLALPQYQGLVRVLAGAGAGAFMYWSWLTLTGRSAAMARLARLDALNAELGMEINPDALSGNYELVRGVGMCYWNTRQILDYKGRMARRATGGSRSYEDNYVGKLVRVGNFAMEGGQEYEHAMIVASTGAGKSVSLTETLADIRARGDRAIVVDNGFEFLKRFYREGDVILNPLDERSVKWQPMNEVEIGPDWDRIARSLVPDGEGHAQEWHKFAQSYFTDAAFKLGGSATTKELLDTCVKKRPNELVKLFEGTPTAVLTHDGNEKMFSNVRTTFAAYMGPWKYLPDDGDFSIRDWVQRKDGSDFLWMPFNASTQDMLKHLIRLWMDLAVNSALERKDGSKTLWFIIDELDTLGRLPSLIDATTKLRKKRCAILTAFQAVSQLKETYGQNNAVTLMSCMKTKVVLNCADAETAEFMSREIGESETDRQTTSYSENKGNSSSTSLQGGGSESYSSGSSTSTQREKTRLVMPSELKMLERLTGFVWPAGSKIVYPMVVPLPPPMEKLAAEDFMPSKAATMASGRRAAPMQAAAPEARDPIAERAKAVLEDPQAKAKVVRASDDPIEIEKVQRAMEASRPIPYE